jgi:hypothetical protein
VFAPQVRPSLHAPPSLKPFLIPLAVVVAVLVAWAALMARPTGNEIAVGPDVVPGDVRSVAYGVPEGGRDVIYVRPADGSGSPRALAAFPAVLNVHARGSASPTADLLAVVHLPGFGEAATLTLIDVRSGVHTAVATDVEYLTGFAWSPDGARLAFAARGAGGATEVREVVAASGAFSVAGRFDDALRVTPVGYDASGGRVFVVVLDRGGSALWEAKDGSVRRVARLSPGLTRDWVLSPDRSRLAFVEALGAGERSYAARMLTIATGTIRDMGGSGDQLGAAWRPGAVLPDYGGPGGSLALTGTDNGYVVPLGWSPDGAMLVGAVVSPGAQGGEAIEVMTGEWRARLAEGPSWFLGWVRNDN